MKRVISLQMLFVLTALAVAQKPAIAQDTPTDDSAANELDAGEEESAKNGQEQAADEAAPESGTEKNQIPLFDLTESDRSDRSDEPDRSDRSDRSDEPDRSDQPDSPSPRLFALGISLLSEHALGAVARLRFNHVAIDLAYGLQTVFFTYTVPDPEAEQDEVKWAFDMAFVNTDAGLVVFFGDNQKGFQNGIRAQGIFNNIMGPGAGLGWVGDLCFKRFVLEFGAGLQTYFKFESWAKDHFELGPEADISTISYFKLYFGVNLLWYLA